MVWRDFSWITDQCPVLQFSRGGHCCMAAGVCLSQAEGILFPFSFSLPYSGAPRLARRNLRIARRGQEKPWISKLPSSRHLERFFGSALNSQEPSTQQRSLSLCPCHHGNRWVALSSFPAIHWQFLSVLFQEVSALIFAKLLSSLMD